jgi:hypothetical protein
MATYHIHHIVPRHAGGTDDPDNLVKVTVEEHAELHFARYLQYGEMGDWVAANTLSGQMTQAEAIAEARRDWIERNPNHHSEAGRKGAAARNLLGVTQKVRDQARILATDLGKKPWWNNGLNNKRSYTCPGEGYVPGKLPHGKHKRTYTQCPHCGMSCNLSNLSRHILSKHF